jgi:hypothetical protein
VQCIVRVSQKAPLSTIMTTTKSAADTVNKLDEPLDVSIIGGSPKAAGIAAKASALRGLKKADVRVTKFERARIGAAWAWKPGYTDGERRLRMIVERDIG